MFSFRNAAENHTPPPYPCFIVWSRSRSPASYTVAAIRERAQADLADAER